jgi:hypothetical protein
MFYSGVRLPYTQVMGKDLFYPPGIPQEQPGPIKRFMPPIEQGSVMQVLQEMGEMPDLIVDPFGSSPELILEAASSKRAILVAANNPITRFVIIHTAVPFLKSNLQAALAKFSTAPKDGRRLEPFLKDLYRTICSRCGAVISADYFVWDKERELPVQKGYTCGQCGHVIEESTNEVDRGLALSHSGKGLQYAMALEQLAPRGDPYRQHAEAALSAYSGRALFGLVTLVSKLNQLDLTSELQSAARALLLYVFDACNALWGYPEGRLRPRRLSLSPQYVERNVWRAMEQAVDAWVFTGYDVTIQQYPEDGLPEVGSVSLFPGSARNLSETLARIVPKWILTVLPRPNQAFWTLSALWAAWLWGRDAALPIKVALRRRRYDWFWHAKALRAVFKKVVIGFEDGAKVMTFLPETEPGFMGSALVGLDDADLRLTGRALRVAEDQALLQWVVDRTIISKVSVANLETRMTDSIRQLLASRGEPTPYEIIHAAVFSTLAQERQLAAYWEEEWSNPISVLGSALENALYNRDFFQRIGRATEVERGLYWLVDPSNADEPIADRVELAVLKYLQEENQVTTLDVFEHIYRQFLGLLSPDRRFVENCLRSYATLDPSDELWSLRDEDQQKTRDTDRQEMHNLLTDIGLRMGFKVLDEADQVWCDDRGEVQYRFRIQETAGLGEALQEEDPPLTYVLPGSRASLVMAKTRRDPRLFEWIKSGPRIIKYRHVRRLAEETTLNRENLVQRFTIDPPEHQDPQLPLL